MAAWAMPYDWMLEPRGWKAHSLKCPLSWLLAKCSSLLGKRSYEQKHLYNLSLMTTVDEYKGMCYDAQFSGARRFTRLLFCTTGVLLNRLNASPELEGLFGCRKSECRWVLDG